MHEITLATPEHLDELVEFNIAMARETEAKALNRETVIAGVKGLLEKPHLGYYVICKKAALTAGCLMVTKEWSDWRNGMFIWIQSVYVRPDFRRQGIYSALYRFVKDKSRRDGGVCGFRLYVEKENRPAQLTYENLGMTASDYLMYEEPFD